MICPNCEHGLDEREGLKYCPYCGKQLGKKSKSKSVVKALAAGIAAALLVALAGAAFIKLGALYLGASKGAAKPEPTALTLSPAAGVVYPGDRLKLEMELYPGDSKELAVTWSSSDESVASVDATGNVAVLSEGDAVITAVLENGVSGEVPIHSGKRPYRISFTKAKLAFEIGEEFTLSPVVSPSDAEYDGVIWSCSDEKVLSIDEEGKFKALSEGRATVTASVAGGVTASADVFVYRYVFDLFMNHVYENGEYDEDYREYFITLDFSTTRESSGLVMNKHTYLSFYPDTDRVILYCDVFSEDGSVYYETLVYFAREDRKYAKFQFYCECENYSGSLIDTVPMSSIKNTMSADAVGRLDLEEYTTNTKLLFENYQGEDSFKSTALQITNALVSNSMLLLKEHWESFGLGFTMEETLGLARL